MSGGEQVLHVAQLELGMRVLRPIQFGNDQVLLRGNPGGKVVDLDPVPFVEITSHMFPKDSNATTERVVVTGSYTPPEKAGETPSQYHLAPIALTQTVHVIYLLSAQK